MDKQTGRQVDYSRSARQILFDRQSTFDCSSYQYPIIFPSFSHHLSIFFPSFFSILFLRSSTCEKNGSQSSQSLRDRKLSGEEPQAQGRWWTGHCWWWKQDAYTLKQVIPFGLRTLIWHTCSHTLYIYTCICTSIHPSIHACMHASMHPCIHTSMHPCIHASMHPCIHTYIQTSLNTYIP